MNHSVAHSLVNILGQHIACNSIIGKKGPDGTMKFFEQLFPELVESNCIGQLTKDSFRSWASGGNEVLVELDNKPSSNLQGAKDIYVGGPAALFSATIQVLVTRKTGL